MAPGSASQPEPGNNPPWFRRHGAYGMQLKPIHWKGWLLSAVMLVSFFTFLYLTFAAMDGRTHVLPGLLAVTGGVLHFSFYALGLHKSADWSDSG